MPPLETRLILVWFWKLLAVVVEIVVGLLLTRMVLLMGLVEPEVQPFVKRKLYMAVALLIVLNLVRRLSNPNKSSFFQLSNSFFFLEQINCRPAGNFCLGWLKVVFQSCMVATHPVFLARTWIYRILRMSGVMRCFLENRSGVSLSLLRILMRLRRCSGQNSIWQF